MITTMMTIAMMTPPYDEHPNWDDDDVVYGDVDDDDEDDNNTDDAT